MLRTYRVDQVHGDRYAGEWPREQFRKHGVTYKTSDRVKSEIYLAALPLLNSQRVELLDNPRMISQLLNLERRTARGGKDSIDHPPNSHDDLINAVAGTLLAANKREAVIFFGILGGDGRIHELPEESRPLEIF